MTRYDVVVVPGSQPDPVMWRFPSHVLASLDVAAEQLRAGAAPRIAVSGRWALSFEHHGIRQPWRECDEMARYLEDRGVAPDRIAKEGRSKDTISNFFYLKRLVLEPVAARRLLIIVADFRLARVQYLVRKILGPAYAVVYQTVPSRSGEPYPHESDTLARTQRFLAPMADGDDAFLADKFYSASYYMVPWTLASKLGVRPRGHQL